MTTHDSIENPKKFKFTDTSLKRSIKASPQHERVADTSTSGLVFIPAKNEFYFHKRVNGKLFKRKIGSRSLLPVQVAQDKAKALYLSLSNGVDPLIEQRKAKAAEHYLKMSLANALEEFLSDKVTLTDSSKSSYREVIAEAKDGRNGLYYGLRDKPLFSITDEHVKHYFHNGGKSPSVIDRSNRTLRAVWNHMCAKYDVDIKNPTRILNKTSNDNTVYWQGDKRRETIVEQSNMPLYYEALRDVQQTGTRGQRHAAYAQELLLVLGLRKKEVTHMQWSWINTKTWTLCLPGEKAKNGDPLTRPLPQRAVEILETMNGIDAVYVFQGIKRKTPIYDTRPALKVIKKKTGLHHPPNDMRRTFATVSADAKVPHKVLKKMLNHRFKSKDVTEGYQIASTDRLRAANERIIEQILAMAGERTAGDSFNEIIKLASNLDNDLKALLVSQLQQEQLTLV